VEVAAACDPVVERARRVAPFATADPEAAIERADAVLVATPPSATPRLAIRALEMGRDVFCEKPIAENPEEGARLVEAVRRTKRKLQVGFFLRHHPAVRRMREWDVGRPFVARLGLFSEAWVSPEHERGLVETYLGTSSPMVVTGAHIADLLLWFAGQEPARVSGAGAATLGLPGPNHEAGLVSFPDGSLGLLEVGWLHAAEKRDVPYPVSRSCQYEFFGPKGSILFEWDTGRLRRVTREGILEENYGVESSDFDAQWEAFFTAPGPDVEAGYRSLKLTHLVAEARRSGRVIEWKP
jgi:predicted dehydrogenase